LKNINNPLVSIILCSYNEEAVIKNTVEEIFKYNKNCEIIVVDDKSKDSTVKILKNLNDSRINIIQRESRGLASACVTGLIFAKSEIICWIDSNLPDLAPRIPDMIKNLDQKNIVIMSRYVAGGGDKRSMQRILTSKLINFVCRIFLGNDTKDYTSGIFAMKKNILKDVLPLGYGHGEYFIEFIYKAKKNGYGIVELPYVQPPDLEGLSKTSGSLYNFSKNGLNYFLRIFITLLNRK
jgi:dolichol-phosphate mannosyltransferase